jgi:glycosyltransferase involved in cell wall biosynthesis
MHALRIALFVPTLGGGGAERVVVTLGAAFVELGHAVDLVLISASGPYFGELHTAIRVVDLGSARALRSLAPLMRYLRRAQPDLMFSTLGQANVVAILARALASPRTKLAVRETITLSAFARNMDSTKEKFLNRLLPHAYKRADVVIAPSHGVAADLRQLMGDHARIATIPNPIDARAIHRLAQQDPSHPWCQPGREPLIVAVGRLTAQKDLPTLIAAFALVRAKRPVRLLILGEGEEKASLQRMIDERGLREHAQLAGFATNPFSFMQRAAAYVLSSRFEGLPNALLQALAVGAPVIATDCPSGPREILDDGRWGRLVPIGDPQAMADAILATLETRPERIQLELFEERYGAAKCARQYLAALQQPQSGQR